MKRIGLFLLALTLIVGANAAKTTPMHQDSVKEVKITQTEKSGNSAKDSVMMSKLSPDQIMQLEKEKIDLERMKVDADHHDSLPLSSFAIFSICMLPFLFVAIIIALNVRAKNAESKRRYDLYTKSLDLGQTVPEHFFDEPKKTNQNSNLKRGILWLVVGVALLISFLIINEKNSLIAGIVPTFVGIGYLLVHFLEKPKTESLNDHEQRG